MASPSNTNLLLHKNALLVLTRLKGLFPTYARVSQKIETTVAALVTATRGRATDVKTLADSYLTELQQQKDNLLSDAQLEHDGGQDEGQQKKPSSSQAKPQSEVNPSRPTFFSAFIAEARPQS